MAKPARKSILVLREKVTLRNGLLREAVIWRIPKDKRYPEGIKYRLVLVEPTTEKVLVLFDNHYPKGHHLHLPDGKEAAYIFKGVQKLIADYLRAIKLEESKLENKED